MSDSTNEVTRYCCNEFEEKATQYEGKGISMYPSGPPKAQFELDSDNSWGINGCCGGGCFVVTGMKYCPFCGAKL